MSISVSTPLYRYRGQISSYRPVLVVLAATTALLLGFGCLALTSVFIQPLEAEFGWTRAEISFSYALAAMGMAFGGLIWGRVSDHIDVRLLLCLGSAGMVSALFSMAAVHTLWQFYAANLLLGAFGFSCLYAPLITITGQWFDERRGLMVGIVTAGGALGQGVLPYLANELIHAFGWRMAYSVVAAATLVAFATTMPLVRRRGDSASANGVGEPAVRAKDEKARVAWLGGAAFLCCACMGIPLVHLASHVTAICGSAEYGSTSLLIAMISGTVGRVCFGVIADRIGNLRAYGLASLIQTLSIYAFTLPNDPFVIGGIAVVFGFGFAGNMTCLILCVREAVGADRYGTALGTVMFVAWAGMGAGGWVGGILYDLFLDLSFSFLLAVVVGFANLAVIVMFSRKYGSTKAATAMSAA